MKVINKQRNSKMCIICGMDNPFGVKAQFYEMENQTLCSIFEFKETHQSYPGRVHGGMITAMLDEMAARVYWIIDPLQMAVTMDLSTKFRKPVPYNEKLYAVAKIIKNGNRYFESECFIKNMNHEVLAEATVRYLMLPNEKISNSNYHEEMPYLIKDDILDIDLGE